MSISFKAPEPQELRPRITVLGVGGAGGNAVNNMIASKLEGVEFVVANTDSQALAGSKAERRVQLGAHVTEGQGAGAQPDIGRAAAEETLDEIMEHLRESHMVFITAGMGGGTGTGAAPVIARAVREAGILTVGVVTKPFAFEGERRMRIAEKGIAELQQFVHTLIVIPNQNLFRVANDRTTFAQAFAMADDVLHAGVRGVTDLIVCPGLINLDFADIKSVITEMGKAMMGTGEAEGEDRAQKAADMAISNPLLDDVSMKGARGVLINITGGPDLGLFEVEAAANRIRAEVDSDANIIFGNTILDDMEGRIRVSVVATGIEAAEMRVGKNIEQFPARAKPRPVDMLKAAAASVQKPVAPPPPPPPPAPAMSANQVHRRIEDLEAGLTPTPHSTAEAMILGNNDLPPADLPPPAPEPLPQARPMAEEVIPVRHEPERKRRGIFGWGRKEERHVEPAPHVQQPVQHRQPAPQQPRALAQAEPIRPAPQQPVVPQGSDLFGDQKSGDQFEIPAFLRRQTN
ncbi:cell division protein FtsZ [Rhizomicrobium electricum]|uniref:Cell division protein FtsZ n=1 Tax=Rhizomicrobium electricum TaxID=480070 RepID=A0ABN1EGJ3_9PROT|nr:cell division protein FtsZ [Rhizomicrobium electricum]NIJ48507.1 cell division protein FtsZ [Rhizomicrobium electricum]